MRRDVLRAADAGPEWADTLRALAPAARKNGPVLIRIGGDIATDARWPAICAHGIRLAEALHAAGGTADEIGLPERRNKGNSHMAMMDRNGDAVAALVQDRRVAKELWA